MRIDVVSCHWPVVSSKYATTDNQQRATDKDL
jgi:hypothetical protein